MRAIKTKNFAQLKIGIARAADGDTSKHVLTTFRPDEKEQLTHALARAAESMRIFVADGLEEALKKTNT